MACLAWFSWDYLLRTTPAGPSRQLDISRVRAIVVHLLAFRRDNRGTAMWVRGRQAWTLGVVHEHHFDTSYFPKVECSCSASSCRSASKHKFTPYHPRQISPAVGACNHHRRTWERSIPLTPHGRDTLSNDYYTSPQHGGATEGTNLNACRTAAVYPGAARDMFSCFG